ncbi:MAG: NAD-dependent epimerase/dehydratase family protein [Anaerolineales bacterium]
MKVVVTGGAGFIGSFLVDHLAEVYPGEIVVIDNLFRGKKDRLLNNIESGKVRFIQGDIRQKAFLEEVFKDCEVVFHLAAQSNVLGAVGDLDYSFSTNVIGTYNVLSAAQENGVKRLVFSSSREVYGEPKSLPVSEEAPLTAKNAYGASKIAGEVYCRVFANLGLETVILRLANVIGPRDTERVIPLFINQILENQPIYVYGKNKVLDFVGVKDVISLIVKVGFQDEWMNQPINCGSGVGTKLVHLAEYLVDLIGKPNEINIAPPRQHEVDGFVADIDKAKQYLGFQPNTDLGLLLPEIIDYWQDQRRAMGA